LAYILKRSAAPASSLQLPQAFSHLALISAAINLEYQLDHEGKTPGLALLRG
jgi:hypothetical protein